MAYGMATVCIGTLAIVAVYNDGAYILIAFQTLICSLNVNLAGTHWFAHAHDAFQGCIHDYMPRVLRVYILY